jgi:hypothetical protein
MNAFTFRQKFLAIFILAISCFLTLPNQAQTIQIDSTFTSDGEIFPFGPNDTIYGLSISGHFTLSSDTSLVRVILTDNSGNEWMVYEAYPMIVEDTSFNFVEECDETCYLDESVPYSIQVQIINASILIDSFNYSSEAYGDLESMQYQSKRNKDLEKIDNMNHFISGRSLRWIAGDNELLAQFYHNKTGLFGYKKYNSLGFDYYISGTFAFITSRYYIQNSGSLRPDFNWREKHDANDSRSLYYDVEDGLNGWITPHRPQGNICGSCWVFAAVASVEAVANLYFNQHCHYNLSEKDVLCCAPGDCCDGGLPKNAIDYISNPGTFNEENYEYHANDPLPAYNNCCGGDNGNFEYILQCGPHSILHNTAYKSIDTIKTRLINTGPLATSILTTNFNHAMSLVGYYTEYDNNNYIKFIFKNSNMQAYYPMNLTWDEIKEMSSVTCPITITFGQTPERKIEDKDQDGYYNWGIVLPEEWEWPCEQGDEDWWENEDWNDNKNRVGPSDDNFFGIAVKPEIKVKISKQMQADREYIEINPGDLVHFDQADIGLNNLLKFKIENPGSAQLNLDQDNASDFGLVTIEDENQPGNYTIRDRPAKYICMFNNFSEFGIHLDNEAGNGALAHIRIHLNELDMDDFEFTLLFNSCNTQEGFDEIEGEENWSDPYKTQLKDIHILRNGELTITGTVILSPEVDIIVEPGGKLILDGGLLTASCDNLWNGIDLWGDWRKPQIEHDQGIIRIINGGTIEFARCGVENIIFNGSVSICTGGIIYADGAVFKDNLIGVRLWPYHNYNPNNGQPMPYFCSLKNSEFKTTQELYDIGFYPQAFINLYEVEGINLFGCNFHNELEVSEKPGVGILSHEASFHVDHLCSEPMIPCPGFIESRFENLEYGIWAGYYTTSGSAIIRNSEFVNNITGIDFYASTSPEVTQNTFYVRKVGQVPFEEVVYCGLYLDNSTGYKVEENSFFTFFDEQQREDLVSVGLVVNNSGPVNNEIYNNTFDGLYAGLIAQEVNRDLNGDVGLQIKCNNFTNDIFDIAVTEDNRNTGTKGIAEEQGSNDQINTAPAGNKFTYIDSEQDPEPEGNYYNVCKDIIYYHHANDNGYHIIPTRHTDWPKVNPTVVNNTVFNPEESCKSHLSGGGPGILEVKSNMIIAGQKADSVQNLLSLLTDGGNTETLLSEIQTSWPDDAYELYSGLIDESPYLSDTTMIKAVEKENVLSPGMVTDILVANPQSAKSENILSAVDERDNPLTEDQLADIGEGRFIIGAKEALESDYSYFLTLKDLSKNDLFRFFKADTFSDSPIDSIINILNIQSNVSDEYLKAFEYLKKGDSINVSNTLADIPSNYILNATQLNEQELYADYFEIMLSLDTASSSIFEMDSIQKATLYNIMSNSTGMLKALARNILIINDSLDYAEPIFLPQPGLKSGKVRIWPVKMVQTNNLMKIYPNPANNLVIIEVRLRDEPKKAFIRISDNKGIILKCYPIEKQSEYLVIPLIDFPTGNVFCQLNVNNNLIETCKLVIVK